MRLTPFKITIADLRRGEMHNTGIFELQDNRKMVYVNLFGKVGRKEGDTIEIEDPTGRIETRPAGDVVVGDYVDVVGKVRRNGSDFYILAKIIKKRDRNYAELRSAEAELAKKRGYQQTFG